MEKLHPVEAHVLLLQLLNAQSMDIRSSLSRKIGPAKIENYVKLYLYRCISFSELREEDANYGSTFDKCCRIIIARQRGVDENGILQKDYIEGMGWKSNNREQIGRILKGEAELYAIRVLKLCAPFSAEVDRQFWRNTLLSFYPETAFLEEAPETENTLSAKTPETENAALRCVVGLLGKDELARAKVSLTDPELEKLDALCGPSLNEKEDGLGKASQLYPTIMEKIEKLQKEKKKSLKYSTESWNIESIADNILQFSPDTWKQWRKNWLSAEKQGFKTLPKNRLRRKHLLLLADLFRLEYKDVLRFLQLGGYWLGRSEEDRAIASYFINRKERSAEDAEQFRRFLQDLSR